jgi:hypothetical protein
MKRRSICINIYFRYLNDLYALECKGNNYSWEQPIIRGTQPAERESHSCVSYRGLIENRSKIIIYGGMNGHRLGDIWSFYLGMIYIFFCNKNGFFLVIRFFTMDTNHCIWFSTTTS